MDPRNTIQIRDNGTLLTIPFDACVAYHGRTSIGGLALGFRLLQHAFARLSPTVAPDRETIRVFTAFPGPGFRDAVELVTRAVTRDAYQVDLGLAVEAPEGVVGRLYFEVTIEDRTLCLALIEGGMSAEFIELGRRHKSGNATPEDRLRWTRLKEALADTVLAAEPGALLTEFDTRPVRC